MTIRERIEGKLKAAFAPTLLDIVDDSARHAGHAGANPQGETHFTIRIVSQAFEGLPRVARQRLVYDALAFELADRVHALSLKTLTPSEVSPDAP
ncbi:MAG: BolA family transcriptional regulator [Alphaproteobacteria bacterium]|nr:BolA family transcriptional regulator [Alphaproteobacteria bacterium]